MFSWLKEGRRKKVLEQPFPPEWLEHLERNVPQYRHLAEEEQLRLQDGLRIFKEEKYWEGCGGLELTDEIEVTIAAQACLLILNLENDFYPNVKSLFIYP